MAEERNNEAAQGKVYIASYSGYKGSEDVIVADVSGKMPANTRGEKVVFKSLTPDYASLLAPMRAGTMTFETFGERYRTEVLEPNGDKILANIRKLQSRGRDIVLCSYEKDDSLSHRSLIASFLKEHGIECVHLPAQAEKASQKDAVDIDRMMAPQSQAQERGTAPAQGAAQELAFKVDIPDRSKKRIVKVLNDKQFIGDLQKQFGLDLREYVQTTRKRNSLEAIAWGKWTPPIKCRPYYANYEAKYISFRWFLYGNDPEAMRVLSETPVPVDTKEEPGEDGRMHISYDRHPLDENSQVYVNNGALTREQVLSLMFTGTLSAPLSRTNSKGEEVKMMAQCHPYNNMRLIMIPCRTVADRLRDEPSFRVSKDEEIPLTEAQVMDLSAGHILKLGDRHIHYDIMEGKLTEVADPEIAKKQYYAEQAALAEQKEQEKAAMAEQKEQEKAAAQSQQQGQQTGQAAGHGAAMAS